MGYSFCRFVCGVADTEMGGIDLHDGEWLWPQGLAHYVEHHSVRLPDEFIETMRSRCWRPPRDLPHPSGTNQMVLKKVGYWCSRYEPTLPHPRALVQPNWYGKNLPRILGYLRGGRDALGDYLEDFEDYLDDLDAEGRDQLDAREEPCCREDITFWENWAKRHGAAPPLSAPRKGPVVPREWLVRPITIEEYLDWEEPLGPSCPTPELLALLQSQVKAARRTGGELWFWQHGNPAREGGAAAGLAMVRNGQVRCEWWLRPGALAEHAHLGWPPLQGDSGK
jgi:hypothetical protein